MNLIVEGVDCAGKSTLVKELKNRFKYDVLVLGHQDGDQFRRYLKAYADHERMVYERSHISEWVYSLIYGRKMPFSKQENQLLDAITAQTSLIVHAHPDLEVAKQRYQERAGVYQQIQLSQLEECIHGFEEYMKTYKGPVITYTSRDWDELESVVQKVSQFLA